MHWWQQNTFHTLSPADLTWARDVVYPYMHAFTGFDAKGVIKFRNALTSKNLIGNAGLSLMQRGLLIHTLGDAYAHTQANGSAYSWPKGHGFPEMHASDFIMFNPRLYEQYIIELYRSLTGGKNPFVNPKFTELFSDYKKLQK